MDVLLLVVVGVDGEIGVFGSGGGATIGIALDMRAGAVGLDVVVVVVGLQAIRFTCKKKTKYALRLLTRSAQVGRFAYFPAVLPPLLLPLLALRR